MCVKFLRFLRSFFSWVGNCYVGFFRPSSSTSIPSNYKVSFRPFRAWSGRSTCLHIPANIGEFLSGNGLLYCQVVTHLDGVWLYFYKEKLRDCFSISISSSIKANKTYRQYRINSISFISKLQDAFGTSLENGQLLKIAKAHYDRDCIKLRVIID